jgi:MFS family permease
MFAVFFIYGGGYALAGLVPTTSLVTRWFQRRRSVALSIASTGLSVGGIAVTPIIAKLIDARSLVEVAPMLAVAYFLLVVPVTFALVRPSPEALGLGPDGDEVEARLVLADELPGMAFADAVRTRYFRFMSLAFVLIMAAQVGVLQHIFKLTKDLIDVDAATLALIVVTSTSVVARLVGGVAAMRVPLGRLVVMLVLVQCVGIVVLGTAGSFTMILVGCVILGSAMGNLLMLHPLLLADAFGVREYSRIYGLGALMLVAGVGLGPFVVGLLRDATSYRTAFIAMAGVALVGIVVLRSAGPAPTAEVEPAAVVGD